MQYSKVAVLAAVSGSAFAAYSNSTVTDIQTTVVTITSCEEDKCSTVPVTTGLTTVTEWDTTYTTYCPLSTVTEQESTTVTITSCEEDKCSTVPVVTGLTTVTEGETIYTTYCPLTAETKAPQESKAPSSSAPAAPAPSTVAEESKAPAASTEANTEAPAATTPTTVAAQSESSAVAAESSPAVSAIEGGAASNAIPVVAGLLALGAFI